MTHEKAEALSEQWHQGTTEWQQACRLTWTPDEVGDWLVFVTFQGHAENPTSSMGVRAQLDDGETNKMETLMEPTNVGLYDYKRHGSFFLLESLSAAEHTVDVDYMTDRPSDPAFIKGIRIVAWRLDDVLASGEYTYEATEEELVNIGGDWTTLVSGSRNDTGKYLILFSVEATSNYGSASISVRGYVNGVYFPVLTEDETHLCKEARDDTNYQSWLHATVVTLSGATDFGIEALSTGPSRPDVRRRRIIAIDLDALGSEGTDYIYDLDTAEANMSSGTPSVRSQIQFTPASAHDYLIIMASAGATSTTSSSVTQDFYKAEGSETLGLSIMDAKDSSNPRDYWGAAVVDMRELAASQHTFQNRWYQVTSGTMFIKGSLVLAIRLFTLMAPTVTTQAADEFDIGAGTLHGTITNTGDENADERGFDWDYNSGTPYAYEETDLGDFGVGAFEEALSGLTQGNTVYFRGKAHNSAGWGYGGELNFVVRKAITRTASAGMGLVGLTGRVFAAFRATSGALGMVGATDRAFEGTRAAAGNVGIVGTSGRAFEGVRAAVASFSMVGTTSRILDAFRSASAALGVVGVTERVLHAVRSAGATITTVGTSTRNWIGTRTANAALSMVGTTERLFRAFRAATATMALVSAAIGYRVGKIGFFHSDIGDEITKNEWEGVNLHKLSDGTSFPGSPTERDVFYRTDLHTWHFYNGTDWIDMVA